MSHNVLIAAGGSGGHMLPAQVVAAGLKEAGVRSSFAAFGLASNPFFDTSLWPYHDIASAPPSVTGAFSFFRKTTKGLFQAVSLLRRERPSLVVGFGSYHVLPILTAATLLRIPTILYAADAVPGRAIRLFAPFAEWTGCFFEEACLQISGKTHVVAPPLRSSLFCATTKEEGRAYFGLPEAGAAVLILGGSQGSKMLNTIVPQAFGLFKNPPVVIHLTGQSSEVQSVADIYRRFGVVASVRGYESQMRYAFAAADAVVARSGASAIAEIEAYEKPAVYIPYPKAKDDHQKKNATLAEALGIAVVVDESEATPELIADHIQRLLARASKKCEHGRKLPIRFVTKILDTLEGISLCQKKP